MSDFTPQPPQAPEPSGEPALGPAPAIPPSPAAELHKHLHELQARIEAQNERMLRGFGALEEQADFLRKLLTGALVALVMLSLGVGLFLYKQQRDVRAQLENQRAPALARLLEFQTKTEPEIRRFAALLQDFAATHPEFRPVLDRYRAALSPYFTTVVPVLPPVAAPGAPPRSK